MLTRVEITVSEPMVCMYCGTIFEGTADLCTCLTVVLQEAITEKNALRKQREFEARERLELDR